MYYMRSWEVAIPTRCPSLDFSNVGKYVTVLVHFYSTMKCVTPVNMISPLHDRAVIDFRATRIEHSVIAYNILVLHAISGANTVSSHLGIGKRKVV